MTGSVGLTLKVLKVLSDNSVVSALTCSEVLEFERGRRGAEVGVLESDVLRLKSVCCELLELMLEEVEDVETEEAEEETVLEEAEKSEEEVTSSVEGEVF